VYNRSGRGFSVILLWRGYGDLMVIAGFSELRAGLSLGLMSMLPQKLDPSSKQLWETRCCREPCLKCHDQLFLP
jgi:hypothetical protein